MGMSDRWYKNAVIYGIDVETFMDANGDGVGDFNGLIGRLDYLSRLGIDCIWLLPIHPTPNRDNGYDVWDHYGVDSRLGTLGMFVEFLREAHARGIRVIIDLALNHTSNEHPWFRSARRDRHSPYRDYYIWIDHPPPPELRQENAFPGQEHGVWTYDEEAQAYYYHRFYHFEPDLNLANPQVREEIRHILGFWLQLGVSGFRLDAAWHMIGRKGTAEPDRPHGILKGLREFTSLRSEGAVLLAEVDEPPEELNAYFGAGDEMHLLFNFVLNQHLFLALVREESEPIVQGLRLLPAPPVQGQWANFLRNYDELNLERLTTTQRQEVYEAFGPQEHMRIFQRGIRRRLAPMLGGDRKRIELAYSLLFSLPGAPVLIYGDEIGMGDDLSLYGRDAVRTPMQWSKEENAGFSTAAPEHLPRPAIDSGQFGYQNVNVTDQHRDPDSFLNWMERLIRTRKETPEFGWGEYRILETGNRAVFVLRAEWEGSVVVAAHNLGKTECTVKLDLSDYEAGHLVDLLGNRVYSPVDGTHELRLEGYGYRWLRVHAVRHPAHYS